MNSYDPLHLIDHPTASQLARLREVLAAAAAVDGSTAFSDQVVLAVSQGTRTLFGIAPTDGNATDEWVGFGVWGAGEADLVVHPNFRGSGLGTRALRALITIAAEAGAPSIRSWSHGTHPAPAALLRGAGFTGIRTLYKMALDPLLLDDAVVAARPLPSGTRVIPYQPENDAHADAWVRLNSAAFADHPEQGTITTTDFLALTREPWFRATDLCFAVRDVPGTPEAADYLGFCWVKTVVSDDQTHVETELYVLGVHPDAAGTGLGAALFGVSLEHMRAHAPNAVSLYVDESNSRAVNLYKRAGFTIAEQSTQWERLLTVH